MREHKHTHVWTPRPATKQYVCTQPGCHCVRVGVLTTADFAAIAQIELWNRAMRGGARARRKFILTGQV